MEGKEVKKKNFTKETIISLIIGLVVGAALTCLIMFLMGVFSKDIVATVNGKKITAQTIYEKAKKVDGLSLMISEIDKAILDDMYTLTEKEEEEAKDEADYYIEYYTAMGYTEEDFLEGNGFSNYEEFLEDIKSSKKSNKYLYQYLEGKLEEGAVQKYYDENKDSIETYDSEHILVKVSDTVTDEQALALANEIIAKLNEGKTFSEIVEEYGDKIIHEELGFQGKTASLEQPYIDELVALEDGAYSKTPVRTSYGYHIVHRLSTSTIDDLRETIIETLSTDLLTEDSNLTYKAFVELRKEKGLEIQDEELKKKYEEYCNRLYATTETKGQEVE